MPLSLRVVNADCAAGPEHHQGVVHGARYNERAATSDRGRPPTVRTAPSSRRVEPSETPSARRETVRCSRRCIYIIWNTFVTSAKHISHLLPIQVDLYYY